jgi:hypothetical protein
MNLRMIVATVVVVGLVAAGWFYRATAPVADAVRAADVFRGDPTPPTLQSAGVHKCVGASGTTYLDGPCPKGSHEVEANGGTMTVTSFPKAAPSPSALASSVFGGPVVKPMSSEERDRLRDKQVEDAANR